MHIIIKILLSLLLASLSRSVNYPGILLQIPVNLELPSIPLGLPIKVADGISAQKLELTDVLLRNLDYSWKLREGEFIVSIPEAVISFHWDYASDSGLGTFTQTYLALKITWQATMDAHSRFKAEIISTKLTSDEKKSKISINLGGNVKETVVIQITNLIVNHAKSVFQKAITNALVGVVESLSSTLNQDVKIYCPESKPCVYLNTVLTSKPFISNQSLLIQMSGDPYILGKPIQHFEPSSTLFRSESKTISLQIHKDIIQFAMNLFNKQSPFSYTIKTTEISSIAEIDSQTLSMVFPRMKSYRVPRPVLLIIDVMDVRVEIGQNKSIDIFGNGKVSVATDASEKLLSQLEPYLREANGTVVLKLTPMIRENKGSAHILKIMLQNLSFDPQDVKDGYIAPEELEKHLETLLTWAAGGTNGDLSRKILEFQFSGIKIHPTVSFLINSISIGIDFDSKLDANKQASPILINE